MDNILFLHGWGGNENSFAPILPFFKTKYNCICVRMPREPLECAGQEAGLGCGACTEPVECVPRNDDGGSEGRVFAWTLERYADLVLAELDEREVEKTHIIAHSFGARVAAILATRQPHRFEKLVLTGPAGIKPRFNLWRWLKIRLHKLKIIKSRGSSDYRNLTLAGKITFQNIIKRDLEHEISLITQPSLIIWGARDKAIKRKQINRWTKLNACTKMKVYEHAGHFCFLDEPARFVVDVEEFLISGRDCFRPSGWGLFEPSVASSSQ